MCIRDRSNTTKLLAFLRFLSIFGLLLLLINPIVSRSTFETVKTPLPIVVDNSSSIVDLKANQVAKELYEKISSNSKLKDKFDVQTYSFDSEFQPIESSDELNFKGKQTNLDEVAKNLKSINKNLSFPTVLISDGNQTSGSDYAVSYTHLDVYKRQVLLPVIIQVFIFKFLLDSNTCLNSAFG